MTGGPPMKSELNKMLRRPVEVLPWQQEVVQLLEEHHLCAWCKSKERRHKFGLDLARYIHGMDGAQVCLLDGSRITSIETFCKALELGLETGRVAREIDSPEGVVGALRRQRAGEAGESRARYRYYIWLDADVLMRRDEDLFCRLVDSIMGVAAAAEYVDPGTLLIHRAVFVGGPALDMFAEHSKRQFKVWYREPGGKSHWQTTTGVKAPRVLRYKIADESPR